MAMKKTYKASKNKSNDFIREVYVDNFVEEMKNISKLIGKYNYLAMDTEFPGIVYQCQQNTRDAYYRAVKQNVDKLKLIQMGITLSDEEGNYPQDVNTWQFNLKFDLNSDQYSNESIALLTNSGINFDLAESRGIPIDMFGEYMISSGLILNDDAHWISFHGIYDFAYYLRSLTNLPLPETELFFFESLKLYFPNYYDIRFLVRYNDSFRGSLSKLGQELNISRVGTQHQAGSDSLITSEIFFKLKKEYLSEDACRNDRNVLFGIGLGCEDNETYQSNYYQGFKQNSNNNFNYDYSGGYYPTNNLMTMQYNYLRNNQNFVGMTNSNYTYPYGNYVYQMNSTATTGLGNSDEKKNKYILKNNIED
jgi:CCR4-NOT transcription complex subunit 7/8